MTTVDMFMMIFLFCLMMAVVWLCVVVIDREVPTNTKVSFMEGLDLTGLPVVTFYNNGRKFNFVLDTGSYNSVINESVLEYFDYNKSKDCADLIGIDGINRKEQQIIHASLFYKDKEIKATFIATELDDVFDAIKRETGVQLHGLLGSTFFKENKYIINYDELVAYSKKI